MTTADITLVQASTSADERQRVLQVVQPGLIGLIDGTVSTLAPIFAAAYVGGSRAALLVGLAAALGAAISMGMSEGLSDDGTLTGRGDRSTRGLITGAATFVGGPRTRCRSSSPTSRPRWRSPTSSSPSSWS